jgi:hypothetical protein
MIKIHNKILIMLSFGMVSTVFGSNYNTINEELLDVTQVRSNAVAVNLHNKAGFCYKVKDAIFARVVQFGMDKSLEVANDTLPAPQAENILMEPFGWGLENVYCASNPPALEQSLFAKYSKKSVAWLMHKIPLDADVQIPLNHQDMLDTCLSSGHRERLLKFGFAGGKPQFPIELADNIFDVVAGSALSGPFGSYIRSFDSSVLPDGISSAGNHYVIDLLNYNAYPVKSGLERLGGRAVMRYNENSGFMESLAIQSEPDGNWVTRQQMGSVVWNNAQKRIAAAMLTDTTFNEHLVVSHLAVSATISSLVYQLPKNHPMRRMLHIHTIGAIPVNKYNVPLLLAGEGAFFGAISSYNLATIQTIMNDHLKGFNFNMLNPHLDLASRRMNDADFRYPYADNAKRIWDLTLTYVAQYVDHYYRNHSLTADKPMQDWYVNVLKYLPNASSTLPAALTRDGLVNLLTGFIYSDSFGHYTTGVEIINWGAWANLVPAKVYSDGSRPRIGDVTNTLNLLSATQPTERLTMSADYFSQFALDNAGKKIMSEYATSLRAAMPDAVVKASVYS